MADDSDLERTEPASSRKIQKARDEGNVPHSRELSTFVVLMAAGASMTLLSSFLLNILNRIMHDGMSFGRADIDSTNMMGRNLAEASYDAITVLLPIFAVIFLVAVAANLAISGLNFTLQPLQLKLDKLNPLTGLGRMFNWQSLVELVKAALKGGIILGASAWMISMQWEAILTLSSEPLAAAIPHFGHIIMYTFLAGTAGLALLALFDVPYQLWHYQHGLRMTKEEVRQESKETEGDPQIKGRIRAMQREQARRRMMQAVPKADVVVTNPLHFAVALQYNEKTMSAPQMLAKGSQLVAERIKEIARENHIPIIEAPPLARALHRHVEVGDAIPATLFTAVAQVLAYVYQLNHQMNPALPGEWQVPPNLDPANRIMA
jgi:flagellar biosynthetic protein FlhB